MVHHIIQLTTWANHRTGVLLSAFPLFHQAGLALGMYSLACGITQVAIPNPRDLASVINAIKTYKPTALVNVPTMYIELSRQPAFRETIFQTWRPAPAGQPPSHLNS